MEINSIEPDLINIYNKGKIPWNTRLMVSFCFEFEI